MCNIAGMNAARFFQRREDYREPTTNTDSPWRLFKVECLKCGSAKLRIAVEHDDGECRVILVCDRCQRKEAVAVK